METQEEVRGMVKETVSINEVKEVLSQIESLEKALAQASPSERQFIKVHLDYFRNSLNNIVGFENTTVEVIII